LASRGAPALVDCNTTSLAPAVAEAGTTSRIQFAPCPDLVAGWSPTVAPVMSDPFPMFGTQLVNRTLVPPASGP
jgi:hypothetical protein